MLDTDFIIAKYGEVVARKKREGLSPLSKEFPYYKESSSSW